MLGAFQVVAPHISSYGIQGMTELSFYQYIVRQLADLNPATDYMLVAYRSSFRPKSRKGRNILNRDNLKAPSSLYSVDLL